MSIRPLSSVGDAHFGKQVYFLTHIREGKVVRGVESLAAAANKAWMTFSGGRGIWETKQTLDISMWGARSREKVAQSLLYGFDIKQWHVWEGMRVLKRPAPAWKHTVLVISPVAFPFQDLFDAFVISVHQEQSASRPQACVHYNTKP